VAGGPFTLAGQLVEGRASRSHRHLKSLLYNDTSAAHELMSNLADLITESISLQLEAGASAFILYDSCAGLLTPRDYREHVASFVTDIFRRVQMYRKPGIVYVNECGHLVDSLVRTGAHVLGLDWRVDLELMRTRLPENISVQGNLDPSVLLGPPDLIRQRVLDILISGTLYRGHVFNLGGGILPDTPTENVQVLVEIVRDFDPNLQGWRSVRS
jgi:uroporphyrinogen decarboxylase